MYSIFSFPIIISVYSLRQIVRFKRLSLTLHNNLSHHTSPLRSLADFAIGFGFYKPQKKATLLINCYEIKPNMFFEFKTIQQFLTFNSLIEIPVHTLGRKNIKKELQ